MLVLSTDEKLHGGADSNGTMRVQPSQISTALQLFPKRIICCYV
jgi:hypothetical protein